MNEPERPHIAWRRAQRKKQNQNRSSGNLGEGQHDIISKGIEARSQTRHHSSVRQKWKIPCSSPLREATRSIDLACIGQQPAFMPPYGPRRDHRDNPDNHEGQTSRKATTPQAAGSSVLLQWSFNPPSNGSSSSARLLRKTSQPAAAATSTNSLTMALIQSPGS